jgi:hypothetical protein
MRHIYQLTAGLRWTKEKSNHLLGYVTDSTLTLIELIQVKKNHKNWTLAFKGDTLPALTIWFHHNLAGFKRSNNDFCFFSIVITLIMMALTHCSKMMQFFHTYHWQIGAI